MDASACRYDQFVISAYPEYMIPASVMCSTYEISYPVYKMSYTRKCYCSINCTRKTFVTIVIHFLYSLNNNQTYKQTFYYNFFFCCCFFFFNFFGGFFLFILFSCSFLFSHTQVSLYCTSPPPNIIPYYPHIISPETTPQIKTIPQITFQNPGGN